MNGTKVWWQSKTVWGSIVALLAGFATLTGLKLDATLQDQLAEIESNRYKFCEKEETAIQNIIDEIVALYLSTLYKLRFLA